MASRRELAGGLIDTKGEDIAAGLVGRNQELAGGIDPEIARRLAHRGLMLHGLQFAGRRINSEHRDGVMTAIGAVQKLSLIHI